MQPLLLLSYLILPTLCDNTATQEVTIEYIQQGSGSQDIFYANTTTKAGGNSNDHQSASGKPSTITGNLAGTGNDQTITATGTVGKITIASMSCSASWNVWRNSSNWLEFDDLSTYMTYTYHNITAPVTTLCEGTGRLVGDLVTRLRRGPTPLW
ncbi:hypothetical protein LTR36_001070 [Oleoguttula mirabilis]|uniref:Uncharacterized protein n=1 Tax=Oleoguttula mirabilis TaxID=1507867 RepID=A0AAV9JPR6_9PEZI|nr:hypothetical protein LTR36_001070 [Oleoguttula mirabilis]